jgi:dihydroneopterin aldolase
VAEEIAQTILASFAVEAVRVRVNKPHVPISGAVLDGAGVEIYRRRDG